MHHRPVNISVYTATKVGSTTHFPSWKLCNPQLTTVTAIQCRKHLILEPQQLNLGLPPPLSFVHVTPTATSTVSQQCAALLNTHASSSPAAKPTWAFGTFLTWAIAGLQGPQRHHGVEKPQKGARMHTLGSVSAESAPYGSSRVMVRV